MVLTTSAFMMWRPLPTRTGGFLRLAVFTFILLALRVESHTWGEQQYRVAPNGTFIGSPGYARGFIPRTGDFEKSLWLIPPAPRGVVWETDKLINPMLSKLTDNMYSDKFPMLKVAPGDWVAFMYLENGHVTKQDIPDGNPKPINRGTVYVYATYENDVSNYNLVDVHLKWNKAGTGGDGKGKLVATRHFDDGQCYETIPEEGDREGITTFRKVHLNLTYESIPCQTDIYIPFDAKVGKKLTHIWVWDWGTTANERGIPVSPPAYNDTSVTTAEIYTSIVDYEIVDPCSPELGEVKGRSCNKARKPTKYGFVKQPDPLRSAIKAQMDALYMVEVPHAASNQSKSKVASIKVNIPMAILVGVKDPVSTRLSPEKLMNSPANPNYLGPGVVNPPSPSVSTLPSSVAARPTRTPRPSPPRPSGSDQEGILTVTVTVPESTVLVTTTTMVTAGPTGAAGPPVETTTAVTSKHNRAKSRRGQGEWTFGGAS